MKIATWNIAGIRARLLPLLTWLEKYQPDIVCLQEIKAQDKDFPFRPLQDLGYHVETAGQKGFNGVAILSKKTPDEVNRHLLGDEKDTQARFIEASFSHQQGALRICSLYAPNGNPVGSDKYEYKLAWMKRLYTFAKQKISLEEPLVLAGDFNVIPQVEDVKNPEQWRDDALYQQEVRHAFFKICTLGYIDAIRATSLEPNYSFWAYTKQARERNNGIRIDHLLLSPHAADLLQNSYVQDAMRDVVKPSDHVPVCIEISPEF